MNNREELLAEIARLNEELANIQEAAADVINESLYGPADPSTLRELETLVPSELLEDY